MDILDNTYIIYPSFILYQTQQVMPTYVGLLLWVVPNTLFRL